MPFWLAARAGVGRLEPLTTELADGRKALCVFSFEEEALLYLRLLRLGTRGGWRAWATGTRELVSVLSDPCREAELVALDPPPQRRAEAALNGLLCVDRGRFVDFLLGKGPARGVATPSPRRGARRGGCPTS